MSDTLIRKLRELVIRADSYLSLLWHRHIPPDRKDFELQIEVERTIGELRKCAKELASLLSEGSLEQSKEHVDARQRLDHMVQTVGELRTFVRQRSDHSAKPEPDHSKEQR